MANLAGAYMEPSLAARKQGKDLVRPSDAQFQAVFKGFTEITDAQESIRVASVFIGLSPPRTKRATKGAYLKLHVSSLLHETYILEERLTSYAVKMGRVYGNKSVGKAADKLAHTAFSKVRLARGSHVHQQRFTDQGLDLVDMIELVRDFKDSGDLYYEDHFKDAQLEWRITSSKLVDDSKLLLDRYFDILWPVMGCGDTIFLPSLQSEKNR